MKLQENCQALKKKKRFNGVLPPLFVKQYLSKPKTALRILFFSTRQALRFYLPWVWRTSGNQHSCLRLVALHDLRAQKILMGVSALLTVLRPASSSAKGWCELEFPFTHAG